MKDQVYSKEKNIKFFTFTPCFFSEVHVKWTTDFPEYIAYTIIMSNVFFFWLQERKE